MFLFVTSHNHLYMQPLSRPFGSDSRSFGYACTHTHTHNWQPRLLELLMSLARSFYRHDARPKTDTGRASLSRSELTTFAKCGLSKRQTTHYKVLSTYTTLPKYSPPLLPSIALLTPLPSPLLPLSCDDKSMHLT